MTIALPKRTTTTETSTSSSWAIDRVLAAQIAGSLLILSGVIILMGIISAEALYPATYTTHENEISDLGATRPPNSVILQPSATIFNLTMIGTGAAIAVAALLLHRVYGTKRVTISLTILGIGILGVGVFPGDNATFHPMFALTTFVAGGFAAVLSAKVQASPFRWLSVLLGATTLGSLAIAMAGDATPVLAELGDGGLERWVAYPVVMWLPAFGAYILGGWADCTTAEG
jgi:hypothetical membrane protein